MSAPPPSSTTTTTATTPTPSVLLPEVLGFVPQFLLDDIVDTANDAVRQAVDAMEVFLRRWALEREDKVDPDWDSTQEVEQGLVAFQTLLNSHVDIAFDFFEAWSLRNIFAVPPDLPVVVPHQAGLNLEHTPDEETSLVHEIRELRRKIHAQRKLERLFSLAVRKSAIQRAQSERRLDRLAFLRAPQMQALAELPDEFLAMHDAVASLPPHDPSADVLSVPPPQPGKRPWETTRTGYLNWAIQQLLERAKERDQGGSATSAGAFRIGKPEDIEGAAEAAGEDSMEVE